MSAMSATQPRYAMGTLELYVPMLELLELYQQSANTPRSPSWSQEIFAKLKKRGKGCKASHTLSRASQHSEYFKGSEKSHNSNSCLTQHSSSLFSNTPFQSNPLNTHAK